VYDTIIIGAGMSGLAAGIRLAHFQQRVCLLEQHTTVGGLNSFYRRDGRNFDVGLHAVTNYVPAGTKRGPLARVLRQLRLSWDDFALVPQIGSAVVFPGVELRFNNDFGLLESEIHRQFPRQKDALRQLLARLIDYDDVVGPDAPSARQVLGSIVDDPLLVEMLLCPVLFYGSAREEDCDFATFSILFRSLFLEGFARPAAGVRQIIKALVRRYKASGGELRLRSGVRRLVIDDGAVVKVVLDDGRELAARRVLSSAGWHETVRLCDGGSPPPVTAPGLLSFVESIAVLSQSPQQLGHDRSIVFFNDSPHFDYRVPREPVDVRSGVICSPNNYAYADPPPGEGVIRISALANFDHWTQLDDSAYRLTKARWYDTMAASAVRFMPDFRPAVIATDMFTPKTIRHYTGHDRGTVYGSPDKHYDGTTHLKNLFLCGNDQGLVGIVGTLLSGITMANKHCLK
jgi:phytoene dehydrogenase-like protein